MPELEAKTRAELSIIEAADKWARDIMRQDRFLDTFEQDLLDSVLEYQRITRSFVEVPPIQIPRPPNMPTNLHVPPPEKTPRYSAAPTIPTPARGTPVVKGDIDLFKILMELDEET